MQRKLGARLGVGGGLLVFILAAVAVWWGLGRLEGRPDWLRVEAPRRAVVGRPLRLRVHLEPLAEPACLCADLHGAARGDGPFSYLASGGFKPAGKGGGSFDFEIMVPPKDGLRYVMGVIFLSRTGQWQDHTLVTGTEVISVSSNTMGEVETRLEPLGLQDLGYSSKGQPSTAPVLRWLAGVVFLVGTVVAWDARRRASGPKDKRWWQVLAVLLALAGLWELLGVGGWLDERARGLAQAEDVYHSRYAFQKVAISVIVCGTALFMALVRRARGARRVLLAVFGLYAGLAAVNIVSLHAIDRIAGLSWHGFALMRTLKLACAVAVLWLTQRLCAVSGDEAGAHGVTIDALKEPAGEEQLSHGQPAAPQQGGARGGSARDDAS